MRRRAMGWALGIVVAGGMALGAQAAAALTPKPEAGQSSPAASPQSSTESSSQAAAQASAPVPAAQAAVPATPAVPAQSGGRLHGVVKSGATSLPGVTVTAQNTLTGKKYSTTTDITGAWTLTIPQNGRYVVRTQFAGFAAGSEEAVLNAASHDQTVTFALLLASRAAAQERSESASQQVSESAIRQLAANGAQSLSLVSALASDTETQAGTPTQQAGGGGASLPSAAGNSDFGGDSVAISGQSGQVSPLAGMDPDRIRDAIETMRAQGGGAGIFGGALGGGGFGGGFGGGGFGGPGGPGGRGNFRGFNPGQPHGSVFWFGTNSALNAEPFSVQGQPQVQPASGSNQFGITFMSAPYIPHLSKPSGKDTMFLTLQGTRQSSPQDLYAIVPTAAERAGDFSAAGLPAIYDPTTFQQFAAVNNTGIANGTLNVIPAALISQQATKLLNKFYPQSNITPTTNDSDNYHLLTTAQTNSTQAGVRYMRALGKNAALPTGGGRGGGGGGNRRNQNQGLRQSINFNYNWSHSAKDNVNIFPQLGGKTSSDSNSLQAGYTLGYKKMTNIFSANWNRSSSQATNFFTNGEDIATNLGIMGPGGTTLNSSPLNYGVPQIGLSGFSGLSESQPSLSTSQTISLSETLSWIHGKHNFRFGGDYRRVHRDSLSGSNATGSFTFSGLFTEDAAGDATTGSALADFLLGLPQQSSIDSVVRKAYLRDNVMDEYAQDDWRILPSLTLMYGLRYEYFAPYTEKYGRLAFVDTNPGQEFTTETEVTAGGKGPFSGALPSSLVFPVRTAFAPRVGFAVRLPKQTVVRAGFGMNYTVGQYGTFASKMDQQPPYADEQTNEEAVGNTASSACARTAPMSCFTLADGFPAPQTTGNYAIEPHYPLPYVQVWNIDVQKSLPWGVVLNAGYNGSKGNHLDMRSAPRATPSSPGTDPAVAQTGLPVQFTYDQAEAFSKLSAGTVRVNKRLSNGIALGANYQYSHSIDDAGAVNGVSQVVAQNWQELTAEEGNSSFDIRHQVSGTYLYELPFGKDKFWVTSGVGSHILEGFSVSGAFTFATGEPLTPSYSASKESIACGTAGALRPNLTGQPVTSGGGSLNQWFNPLAYSLPTATGGYCNAFGDAPRNSIAGPGTVTNNMSLSKTMQMGDTRSMEIRATINNVFNTVQYAGVGTVEDQPRFGEVTSAGTMRNFQFTARFRF